MYSNNEFNFGVTVNAEIFNVATKKFIKSISVEIEQGENENASFVGTGIASKRRLMTVYTFDDVSGIEPYENELKIENEVWQITSIQKLFVQKPKRYSIKPTKAQYSLTLE